MVRLFGQPSDRYAYDNLVPLFSSLNELVEARKLPGVVLTLIGNGDVVLSRQLGYAGFEPEPRPMRHDTIFDLASLTKVVATTPVIMMMVERGKLHLGDPVSRFLPVSGPGKEDILVWHLLTHTSGLPAWVDLYSHGWSPSEMLNHTYSLELEAPPGEKVIYSDLGYMWLKEIFEKVSGETLDDFTRREIYIPLDMRDTGFCPAAVLRNRIAATEYDSESGERLVGVVHDENARAYGGVAGHAGLFSTVGDLARFVLHMMNPDRAREHKLLTRDTIKLMTRNHTAHLGAWRGLGWSIKSPVGSSSGDLFTDRAYGHTGFTGTSIWVDPERDMAVILLTNRVYYGREETQDTITRLRPLVHNAAVNAFLRGR